MPTLSPSPATERAIAAVDAGRFDAEIVGVETARGTVLLDEGPRRDTSLEVLAGLRPVVRGGSVVTAGNSSALNDGASAIVVASAEAVEKYGLVPRARIVVGAAPASRQRSWGSARCPRRRKALDRAGLAVD